MHDRKVHGPVAYCSRCGGLGFLSSLTDEEDQLGIMDACYHCATTGLCVIEGCRDCAV